MTKKEFLKTIQKELSINVTLKDLEEIINTMPIVIKKVLKAGDDVKLTGFLTFSKKHVPAKSGVSKIGGVEKPWTTEAHDEVSVKISKSYKAI